MVVFLCWCGGCVFVMVRWCSCVSIPHLFSAPLSVRMGRFDPQGKDSLAQLALGSGRSWAQSPEEACCCCGGVAAFL